MKKILMTLGLTTGIFCSQSAMACATGQQGIGYQNNSTASASVSIVDTTTSNNVFSDTSVNPTAFYEFCWPTNTTDTYKITQTFSDSTPQYIEFSAQDFKNANYYINVSSNQTNPAWTAATN